jgi:nucleoside-diphosphate-sugar epimerase
VPSPDEPTILVTGASAAVGRVLLEAIAARGWPALALSRREPPAWAAALPQASWCRGSLDDAGPGRLPPRTILLSAGPLAALANWLERVEPDLSRLVALSSTSRHVKRDSVDPAERAMAMTLADAEHRIAVWCAARRVPWTILRPTLIVSARDGDALDWIARAARRFGFVVLPRACHGQRQPVAATDVAAAMLAAIDAPNAMDRAFDLPGGETLPYLEMVRRVIAARAPGARLLIVPTAPYRLLATMARRHPALAALTPAVIERMSADLVFDGTPVAQALGLRFGAIDPLR